MFSIFTLESITEKEKRKDSEMAELSVKQFDALAEIGVDGSHFASSEAKLSFDGIHYSEDETGNACCRYWNAATCPDCGAGMVRLGSCFSCQSCGYETCGG
jgi:hypothetical protein